MLEFQEHSPWEARGQMADIVGFHLSPSFFLRGPRFCAGISLFKKQPCAPREAGPNPRAWIVIGSNQSWSLFLLQVSMCTWRDPGHWGKKKRERSVCWILLKRIVQRCTQGKIICHSSRHYHLWMRWLELQWSFCNMRGTSLRIKPTGWARLTRQMATPGVWV